MIDGVILYMIRLIDIWCNKYDYRIHGIRNYNHYLQSNYQSGYFPVYFTLILINGYLE